MTGLEESNVARLHELQPFALHSRQFRRAKIVEICSRYGLLACTRLTLGSLEVRLSPTRLGHACGIKRNLPEAACPSHLHRGDSVQNPDLRSYRRSLNPWFLRPRSAALPADTWIYRVDFLHTRFTALSLRERDIPRLLHLTHPKDSS
jgi:hypothetical protein